MFAGVFSRFFMGTLCLNRKTGWEISDLSAKRDLFLRASRQSQVTMKSEWMLTLAHCKGQLPIKERCSFYVFPSLLCAYRRLFDMLMAYFMASTSWGSLQLLRHEKTSPFVPETRFVSSRYEMNSSRVTKEAKIQFPTISYYIWCSTKWWWWHAINVILVFHRKCQPSFSNYLLFFTPVKISDTYIVKNPTLKLVLVHRCFCLSCVLWDHW